MTRITEKSFKHGTVNYLIKVMKEKEIKPKRIEYLESIKDIDKAYVIANRYIRNYINNDNRINMEKFKNEIILYSDEWKKHDGEYDDYEEVIEVKEEPQKRNRIIINPLDSKTINKYTYELIKETNKEFFNSIKQSDNSIFEANKTNESTHKTDKIQETFDISLIKLAIEKGVNRFNREFLEKCGFKGVLVGYKDNIALYYCENINSILEIF